MAALTGLLGDYGTDDESMATGREGTGEAAMIGCKQCFLQCACAVLLLDNGHSPHSNKTLTFLKAHALIQCLYAY